VGLRQFWQQVRGGDDPVENGPERAPVGFTRESWRERVDIFRAAYDDVVSFNRHYDERLRTLITALSFLTVAGITLFIFNPADASHPADLTFDGHSWNAANVFFLTFMVAVASSLASAVTGMDPTSHRPHFVGEKPNSESMLYYEAIAAPAATWQELRDATPLQLQRHLAESYRRDAEALARRARHKVLRTGIAQAYMSVAVIALVLLAIVRLPDSGAQRRADLVLLAILLFASIPFFTYRFFRAVRFPTLDRLPELWRFSSGRLRRSLTAIAFYFVIPAILLAQALLSKFSDFPYWVTITTGMTWIVSSRLLTLRERIGGWLTLFVAVGVVVTTVFAYSPETATAKGPLEVQHRLYRVGTNGSTEICLAFIAKPSSTVVLTILGGITSPSTPAEIPIDASGHGAQVVRFRSPGVYSFTIRQYATDIDEISRRVDTEAARAGSCPR
jgi:hypothetical protein